MKIFDELWWVILRDALIVLGALFLTGYAFGEEPETCDNTIPLVIYKEDGKIAVTQIDAADSTARVCFGYEKTGEVKCLFTRPEGELES